MATPGVPATPRTIITPEQFDAIYATLPDADAQLLVETAIETGLRWGELTDLRPCDLEAITLGDGKRHRESSPSRRGAGRGRTHIDSIRAAP
jgi:integrase